MQAPYTNVSREFPAYLITTNWNNVLHVSVTNYIGGPIIQPTLLAMPNILTKGSQSILVSLSRRAKLTQNVYNN